MPGGDRILIGLVPGLSVPNPIRFGPLTLLPIVDSAEDGLQLIARRYANERGANAEHQAVAYCDEGTRTLVPTIWPLFVFACVSRARRRLYQGHGVSHPENFHVVSAQAGPLGFTFSTGHSMGIGEIQHVPLRWPVDHPVSLLDQEWDARIELGCSIVSRASSQRAEDSTLLALGMAADLANAAMESRQQRVENVAPSARAHILLASAFETLHSKGSDAMHSHPSVVSEVNRLSARGGELEDKVFATPPRRVRPEPKEGADLTRPAFVVADLFWHRNMYAHGRIPLGDGRLPPELHSAHGFHAASCVLSCLVGDELMRRLDCEISDKSDALWMQESKHGVGFKKLFDVFMDWASQLKELTHMVVPPALRRTTG